MVITDKSKKEMMNSFFMIMVYKMNKSSNVALFLQNLQLLVLVLMTTVIIVILFLIIFLKGKEDRGERTKGTDKE